MISEATLAPQATSLHDLEKRISLALTTERVARIEIGEALIEIRERQLYRELGVSTFDEYLKKRWTMSRSRAYQLIDLALVHRENPGVVKEFHARKVAPSLQTERRSGRVVREMTKPSTTRGERERAATGTCDEVHVIVGFYTSGRAVPRIRVASCQDLALDIRDEMDRSGEFRKVRVVCQEVER